LKSEVFLINRLYIDEENEYGTCRLIKSPISDNWALDFKITN